VLVINGLTGEDTTVTRASSEYQVNKPDVHNALRFVLSPEHMAGELADAAVGAAGIGVTVIMLPALAGLSQPVTPFTHFAVYVVVFAGDTEIVVPVAPLDHEIVSGVTQPVAVNEALSPEQIKALEGLMLGATGKAFTVTDNELLAGVEQDTAVPVELQVAV
jgi:hypothetical protein